MIVDSSFNLAVHALVCLSHSGRSLSSEALAENICTNPTRVRRVQAVLKKAGIVETREGLDGGYPGNAGFDRYPRFLKRHEVCYMEAYHRSAP